jgi:hypothetical protein
VRLAVSASFDVGSLSPWFSYNGRTISTPFLSSLGLDDSVNDWRLLGNCVYLSFSNRRLRSFADFFTGTDVLGTYDLGVSLSSGGEEVCVLPRMLSYAIVKYYLVNPSQKVRISEFLDGYDEARELAEMILVDLKESGEYFFLLPSMIRSCIKYLTHPLGIFSCVQTMAGSISGLELLLDFRRYLVCGGES